jgi:hypothetical protein
MRLTLVSMLLLAGLAGCGVKPPIEGRADPFLPVQISIAEADLANKTAVGTPIMERRNGILYVTVPVRSASDYDLRIDQRWSFLSAQGRTIYQGSWEGGKKLVSNVQDSVSANALNGDAADFRLELRYSE